MHYSDINERYTAIIAEYLAKGYIIDTRQIGATMNEERYINLFNDVESIRIVVRGFSEYADSHLFLYGIEIVVGKANNVCSENNRPDLIKQEPFYEIGTDRKHGPFYGTKKDTLIAEQLREQRTNARQTSNQIEFCSLKAMTIAKHAVRRMVGLRCIHNHDVKIIKRIGKHSEYSIIYMGSELGLQ